MIVLTSVLKSVEIPNNYPQLQNILVTTNISPLYIHLGTAPDMEYERSSDIILAKYIVKFPKRICSTSEINFYQSTGSDGFVSIIEV